MKIATGTTALAMTRDCDHFYRTASSLSATTATTVPKWVIDSAASRHLCNDCSSFSPFKKFSIPIVIELGDNNSATPTHCRFVDIIPGVQVEAIHSPTFRHCLLLINPLDLGVIWLYFGTDNASPLLHLPALYMAN